MPDVSTFEFIAVSELAIILLVIGLLVYAAAKGFLNTRLMPASSLALIVTAIGGQQGAATQHAQLGCQLAVAALGPDIGG